MFYSGLKHIETIKPHLIREVKSVSLVIRPFIDPNQPNMGCWTRPTIFTRVDKTWVLLTRKQKSWNEMYIYCIWRGNQN